MLPRAHPKTYTNKHNGPVDFSQGFENNHGLGPQNMS